MAPRRTNQPRIRDLYREYAHGRIPFEEVVRAADRVLERFAQARTPALSAESQPAAELQRD